ncbi:MAG: Hsp20/alpha crystallin family protein [Cyclobacteriaceae bacterium]
MHILTSPERRPTMFERRTPSQNVFHRIGNRFNDYFDGQHFMGQDAFGSYKVKHMPPVNIKQQKDIYLLEVVMPGFKKEEITVSHEGTHVRVKAEFAEGRLKDEYLVKELHWESVDQMLWIPDNVDAENIDASYEDGILRIKLPYIREDEPTSIEVV